MTTRILLMRYSLNGPGIRLLDYFFFFFQAEDGIRDKLVTGVQTCALPIFWHDSPAFNAYRGDAWMKEPCRSCPEKVKDYGGCRWPAHLMNGDAAHPDPVCDKSPFHGVVPHAVGRAPKMGGGDQPEREAQTRQRPAS